jgi:type VI secretion system protein ImpC
MTQPVHTPLVKITYDIETGGTVEKKEIPFVIVVLADLDGNRDAQFERTRLKERRLMDIDQDCFAAVIAQFNPIEKTRRGLQHLVMHLKTDAMLRIKVLNASKQELLDDCNKAVAFDQSVLFKRLYESTYGNYGGVPISLIVGDYEIGLGSSDIDFLGHMSRIAAVAHAPFLAGAASSLLGLDDFADIGKPRLLSNVFETSDHVGWQEFRATEDSRYVALALPRADLRELASAQALMCNAAYAFAVRMGKAFTRYQWPVLFNEFEDESFTPEVTLSVHRAQELGQLGFIALCVRTDTTQTAFIGTQTTHLPKKYFDDDTNRDEQQWSQLPCILIAARFAHYLKIMLREKIGSFLTCANAESYLNSWISQYVLMDENASMEIQASYPLREAHVTVTTDPHSVGAYKVVLLIKPHFQMPWLMASLRLEVDIPV